MTMAMQPVTPEQCCYVSCTAVLRLEHPICTIILQNSSQTSHTALPLVPKSIFFSLSYNHCEFSSTLTAQRSLYVPAADLTLGKCVFYNDGFLIILSAYSDYFLKQR
jgi:hypothetical protein